MNSGGATRLRGVAAARPVVLGVLAVSGRCPCGRRGSSGGLGSRRLHDLPRRALGCPAQLGRSTPASLTSTRSTGAATSLPGRSPSSSPPRCGLHSAHCANEHDCLRLSSGGGSMGPGASAIVRPCRFRGVRVDYTVRLTPRRTSWELREKHSPDTSRPRLRKPLVYSRS